MESDSSQAGVVIVVLFMVLSNIGLIVFIVFFIRKYLRSQKHERKNIEERQLFATSHKYGYAPAAPSFTPYGSYKAGEVTAIVSGRLQTSRNIFYAYLQKEVRSSGKNSVVYNRSVLLIDIPNVVSHFIFNSKLNDTTSTGGNLEGYRKSQILELEGNFSEFFDIYVPTGDENDVLTILAPNAMQYLLTELEEYDIEIIANKLILYSYKVIDVNELEAVINKADALVTVLKLREGDVRSTQNSPLNISAQQAVARTVTDNQVQNKLKRSSLLTITTFCIVSYVLVSLIAPPYKDLALLFTAFIIIGSAVYKNLKVKRLKKRYSQSIRELSPPTDTK